LLQPTRDVPQVLDTAHSSTSVQAPPLDGAAYPALQPQT
jgi:hypothetical protein